MMHRNKRTVTTALFDEFVAKTFQQLTVEDRALSPLLPFIRERVVPSKSPILRAGDYWNKVYVIQRGIIRLYYLDLEGKESNKAFFGEGDCIWPVAPHDRNEAVQFTIEAIEETTLLECPFQQLYEHLQQIGKWETFALPFAEMLVEQKMQREHDFLLLSATERFVKFSTAHPEMVDRIPDYHLASFLGVTNVSLSRIKRSLF
ncbi:MAG: Crp/Fnr family transcriptional regulator [Caldilineaceae bacterium]|nr:Crp/Fnr family transcriptional regulator [Caldilineaceae bacterium]